MQTSQEHEFFLVSLPGLEDLLLAELSEWYPDLKGQVIHGGVTVNCPLVVGLSMNQNLKIPTRILLRISNFVVRDFPKLYNKILQVDWSQWILPNSQLSAHAATARSRLKIKNRIEETVEKGFKDWQKKQKIAANIDHKVDLYIRLSDNKCTLSLDTSGDRLHKRGIRSKIGAAPLRETIAAAMVQMVSNLQKTKSPIEIDVVDPMMGAGTFLIEAVLHNQSLPPRNYKEDQLAPAIATQSIPTFTKSGTFVCRQLYGFERSAKTIAAAEENFKNLNSPIEIKIIKEDFFKAQKLPTKSRARWVFNNPPYGERIQIKEPLKEFYEKLFAKVEELVAPDWACFILPNKISGKLQLPAHWRVKEKRRFLNGGISVIAYVFAKE